jgi:ABC-type dipeptide/oligopeptide/nickel transport system permease component
MPNMNLTHFEATLLLALLISVILGVVSRKTNPERIRYGLRCFGYFLLAVFGLGWLMYFGHG